MGTCSESASYGFERERAPCVRLYFRPGTLSLRRVLKPRTKIGARRNVASAFDGSGGSRKCGASPKFSPLDEPETHARMRIRLETAIYITTGDS